MSSYRLVASEQGLRPVVEFDRPPASSGHLGEAALGSGVVGWRPTTRHGATSPEATNRPAESVTQNDGYIVEALLHDPSVEMYDVLVGKTDTLPRWPAGTQQQAQEGIAALIQTEYEPSVRFEAQGIRHLRKGLQTMRRMGHYDKHAQYGRKVEYQSTQNPEAFDDTHEDYLHFGVRNKPAAHMVLPSPRRIYVNASLIGAGKLAAEVVTYSRLQGVEPYGKVLDQSTKATDISLRKDSLLFVADTQQQLDVVMQGLRQSHRHNAALFNKDVLLMTEATDIPGVGLADEPPKEDIKLSYNERAEALAANAWNAALDTVPATKLDDPAFNNSVGGKIERVQRLKDVMRSGGVTKEQLTQRFGVALRHVAPALGISPDHISRNL